MSDFLDQVMAVKRDEVRALLDGPGMDQLRARALAAPPARDLLAALRGCAHVPIIAEVKKASPSLGGIKPGASATQQALLYQSAGAAACSVLCDRTWFKGSLEDLAQVRVAVDLPLLAKDFMIHPAQVLAARAAGADSVLLMAACLAPAELAVMFALARELGMTPLVEVHDPEELGPALAVDPPLLGINHRNLRTLEMDMDLALKLRPRVPPGITVVAESGVKTPGDIARLRAGGLDAFLIGSSLMLAEDPAAALAALCRADEA